jgi:hypothetical protein
VQAGKRRADDPKLIEAKDSLQLVLATEATERLLAMLSALSDESRSRVVNLIETGLIAVSTNCSQ